MRGEFLDLSGARVYYYAAGTRGAGVPIVLIHGFPTSGHLWAEVVPLLPAGHRVVVLDLLGFGRSDPPGRGDVSIGGHADRVIELFDVLGIKRACVVGHDTGGGIAQSIALRHAGRVSHLALVDSVAFDTRPPRIQALVRVFMPLTRHLPASIVVSALRRELLRGYEDHDQGSHSLDMYLRPFCSPAGRSVLMRHLRALDRRETAALGRRLPEIEIPACVIAGTSDPFVAHSVAEQLRAQIRGSRLYRVAGARHFTPEEVPRAVADAVCELLDR